MEKGLEFFVNADEVWYDGEEGLEILREDSPVVADIVNTVRELYPQAYDALRACYERSMANVPYFNFLMARRFCKCNFGNLDHTKRDSVGGVFNFERVSCPLQGECKYEGVICMPSLNMRLSDAEKRVMRLVCEGRSNQEIADELYLSPNTVKRHISNSYLKTRTKSRAEFVKYAKDIQLF